MCKTKMAVDAAQPTPSPRRPTTQATTFTSSSSEPSTSSSNTSYKALLHLLPDLPRLQLPPLPPRQPQPLLPPRATRHSTPSWRVTLRAKDTVVFQRKLRPHRPHAPPLERVHVAGVLATKESDVYAFGVVMLELLLGQEPIKYKFDKSSGDFVRTSVVETAQAAVDGGGLRSWVDRKLKDSFPEKMTRLALECVQMEADKRPRMGRVAGKISKFYLESRTWSEKFNVPDGISISLAPR